MTPSLAPVGTETLYEAPVFAGFDWRAVLLRGKVGEVVRTKPAVPKCDVKCNGMEREGTFYPTRRGMTMLYDSESLC
jgi:hypothetical protein